MTFPLSSASGRRGKVGAFAILLFAFCFALVAFVTLGMAIRSFVGGDDGRGAFLGVFGLSFGGFGFAMGALMLEGRKEARRVIALRAAHPVEPWKWREDWAAGEAASETKHTMEFAWFISILWNLVSSPLLFLLPSEIFEKGNYPAMLGLLFPVVGVGLLIRAIRETIEWRKFGNSVFRMNTVPGVIGGEISGTVDLASSFDPGQVFDASLSCINRRKTSTGKTTSTIETILWQEKLDSIRPEARLEAMGSAVPVRVSIPPECLPSDGRNPNNAILWRLEVHAAVPGVDYDAKFEVPVFTTASSKASLQSEESQEPPPSGYEPTAGAGISLDALPTGGAVISVKPARVGGPLAATAVFTALWTGVIVFLAALGVPGLFVAIFSLFELILLFAVAQLGFGRSRILFEADSVTVQNSVAGIAVRSTISARDIESVTPTIGMQSGKSVLYAVTITFRNGRKQVMRVNLKEKHDAEWLAAEIRRRISQMRQTSAVTPAPAREV